MNGRKVATAKKGWTRHLFPIGVTLGLLGLAYLFIGSEHGWLEVRRLRHQLAEAEDQLARMGAESDSLKQVVWLLENDLGFIEKVAREEYGMIKDGEWVYRLRQQTADPAQDKEAP